MHATSSTRCAATGTHDRARHPRHERGRAVLPPGDAARPRRHRRRSAIPTRSRTATCGSTSPRTPAPSTRRTRSLPRARSCCCSTPGSSATASAPTTSSRGASSSFHAIFEAPTEIPGPSFGFVIVNEDARRGRRLSRRHGARRRRPRRPARGGRARCTSRRRSSNRFTPGRYAMQAGRSATTRSPSRLITLPRVLDFVVFGTDATVGLVSIVDEIELEPETEPTSSARRSAVSAAPEALELRPVRGPSALGGGRRRFFELLWLMAVTEFKRTYFGTVLGYVWSLLRPLLLFAVLLFVFTKIFRLGSTVADYPELLLFNIVLFGFFQESTTGAVTSVVAQEGIVRKTQFPRLVIPLSIVLTGPDEPRPQPDRRLRLHHRGRRRPDVDLAAAAGRRARAGRADDRRLDAALGALRALPRPAADLDRGRDDALLRHADPLPDQHPDHRGLPGAADGRTRSPSSSSRPACGSSTRPPRRRRNQPAASFA